MLRFWSFQKLNETNEIIDVMKVELTDMEPKLAAKSVAVAELLVYLTKEQAQADKVRNIVKADEEVAKVRRDILYLIENQNVNAVVLGKS